VVVEQSKNPRTSGQGDVRHREVHVHLLAIPAARSMDGAEGWALDATERARVARLRRPADQWLYACAHTLLRRVLSDCAPIAPADWRFEAGRDGKPALCRHHHPGRHHLRFNLSHCPGLVAAVVAHDREVGIDVEPMEGLHDLPGLAAMILTPDEWRRWEQVGPSDLARRHFLLDRWTRKEATLKAMGWGLGRIDPHRFSLGADCGQANESPWWDCTAPVDPPHHCLAVAGERLPGESLPTIRLHHWTTAGPATAPRRSFSRLLRSHQAR
jgi:4'-phosphopantetheinyl transferase